MSGAGLLVQLLNGLASASSLFLTAVGLSLIFGVTRVVNFAHGSLYMLGLYIAYSAVGWLMQASGGAAWGFWFGLLLAALAVGAVGALVEVVLLRRIYKAPELFQLLATFALVLIIKDVALSIWGPEDLLGPRAPGFSGAVQILGHQFPSYDLLLIVIGPAVLLGLWLLLAKTRWGTLVRAATQDREMVSALGVNQSWLFTSVFALGAMLAGLGGALQLPREPASLALDMTTIGEAFVVVVVGGMGSIPGAYVAALIIAEIKALCMALGDVTLLGLTISFPKLTLVVEFAVMAVVLVLRPWGLLGKPMAAARTFAAQQVPLRRSGWGGKVAMALLVLVLAAWPWLVGHDAYSVILWMDILVAVLFAFSLYFIMGPAGMNSFGHAAYFGLGAYGAAILLNTLSMPMAAALAFAPLVAGIGAVLFGWFCVRLSGVYLAMLTLAFSQIVWSVVYQWDSFTGGSNGMWGIWPAEWLSGIGFYYMVLICCVAGIWLMRRMLFSPLGYAMRATRDSPWRADAVGIDVKRVQWAAFIVAGLFAGMAGALFAFSKGSIDPDVMSVNRSVEGLVMVLLGGVQYLAGPLVGASGFTWLKDTAAIYTEYWRFWLGLVILILVLLLPQGLAGTAYYMRHALRWRLAGSKAAKG